MGFHVADIIAIEADLQIAVIPPSGSPDLLLVLLHQVQI
jgi:hypothetical protein